MVGRDKAAPRAAAIGDAGWVGGRLLAGEDGGYRGLDFGPCWSGLLDLGSERARCVK